MDFQDDLPIADSFADDEPDWGEVDKARLPRPCFLDEGEPGKKSTWRYPYRWVEGGAGSDAQDLYTSGTIRPHRGGIQAAWAAANGARSGRKDHERAAYRTRPEILRKLEAVRKRCGLTAENAGPGPLPKDGGQLDFGPSFVPPGILHTHEVHPNPPPWESVDEKSLPNGAFADTEKRLYPHHHVAGSEPRDRKMYLHAAGAKGAFGRAVIDGASEQVVQHLATHAFNLAVPEYTAPQGVLGSGSNETGAPQFGPGGKEMPNGENRVSPSAFRASHSASSVHYKDALPADGSAAPSLVLDAPDVATGAGYIEGYAAIFGNVDSQGEIIRKGAFAKTVRERVPAGKVKLMTVHLSKGGSTMQVIGTVTQAREDDRGLWIHAEFAADPDSQAARSKAAGGHVRGLSIGYYPLAKAETLVDGEPVTELREIKLLEVTLTPFPANELAEVTSAKSLDSLPPATPHGAGPAKPDWGFAVARRRFALARLEMED